MTFRTPAAYFWLFAVFTAVGVFFATHAYLEQALYSDSSSLARCFINELAGAYSAMVLVPGMSWLARRYRFSRGHILAALGANALGLVVYTLLHTTINSTMRAVAGAVFAVHGYTLAGMLPEVPAEAASDAVYFSFIMASLYLLQYFFDSQTLETRLAEAKLENLRLQLHPHFLFNTLNAISSVMYEDVERADAMLSKLSDFLRAVLDSGTVNEVALEDELAIERMYVDIMTTRLERKLRLSVDVADDARNSAVPFMLLQPLIENSIRHGMGSTRDSLDVEIGVRRDAESTVITVDDNGLGIEATHGRGIGLENVSARLTYMYGERAAFSIAPRPNGGTRAVLRFPYAVGDASCR